jgi:hypothetical protein
MPTPPEEREGSAEDALRRLEQRLDRASEAAERLMAQAAAGAAGDMEFGTHPPSRGTNNPGEVRDDSGEVGHEPSEPVKPPPAGWQIPEDGRAVTASDLDPFISLVQAVRDLIPPDLQRRLIAAVRELLLALRALIDWYLDRLERRREQSVQVEDIPIL